MLEAHLALNQVSSSFIRNQFNKSKEKLKEKLSDEEIEEICGEQLELNELERELENLQTTQLETKIAVDTTK